MIFLTAGTAFIFLFWTAMTGNCGFLPDQPTRDDNPIEALTRHPPEALMWFNPFVAQVDVMCGTESGIGGSCQVIAAVTNAGQRLRWRLQRQLRDRPRLLLAAQRRRDDDHRR